MAIVQSFVRAGAKQLVVAEHFRLLGVLPSVDKFTSSCRQQAAAFIVKDVTCYLSNKWLRIVSVGPWCCHCHLLAALIFTFFVWFLLVSSTNWHSSDTICTYSIARLSRCKNLRFHNLRWTIILVFRSSDPRHSTLYFEVRRDPFVSWSESWRWAKTSITRENIWPSRAAIHSNNSLSLANKLTSSRGFDWYWANMLFGTLVFYMTTSWILHHCIKSHCRGSVVIGKSWISNSPMQHDLIDFSSKESMPIAMGIAAETTIMKRRFTHLVLDSSWPSRMDELINHVLDISSWPNNYQHKIGYIFLFQQHHESWYRNSVPSKGIIHW